MADNGSRRLDPRNVRRSSHWLKDRLGALALFAYRRAWTALAIALVLTGLGAAGMQRLHLDADLTGLLPKTFPSVQDLDELKRRFGGVGYVVVVARNAPPDVLKRFANEVAPKLAALDTIRYVEYKRPVRFFEDHGLYYLDVTGLTTLADRLEARIDWEERHQNPMFIDFEESEPPPIAVEDLIASGRAHGPVTAAGDGGGRESWLQRQWGREYYLDPDERLLAMLAKPTKLASDFAYTKEVVDSVQALVNGLDLSAYHPDLEVALSGRYKKKLDQKEQVSEDLRIASLASFLLVLLYLGVHFRRPAAVLLITVPLVLGLVWSYGFAGFLFGKLNILTGFLGAILLGLGIDHGIHFLSRYYHEFAAGTDREEAIRRTFAHTGRAVIIAALTTTVAFAGIAFSEFLAFREFGIIAAAGMVFVVLAYGMVMPALIRLVPLRRPAGANLEAMAFAAWARLVEKRPRTILAAFLAVSAALLSQADHARFNYDFNTLEDSSLPSYQLDLRVNELLGFSQTPVVILADDLEQERQIAAALRRRVAATPGGATTSTVDFVASVADMVPERQAARRATFDRLAELADRIPTRRLDPEARHQVEVLRRAVTAGSFGIDDLPVSIRRQFRGPNTAGDGGFVLVFPAISLSEGKRVRELAGVVRGIDLPTGETVSASGEAMILADVMAMVSREGPPILFGTLALILIAVLTLLGSVRGTLVVLAPALVSVLLTFGMLPVFGLELNYLNIILIPVLFGMAVDGGVHLITRLDEGHPFGSTVVEVGGAIAGSILTTGFGFGAMTMADHSGLQSFGRFAVAGLGANFWVCIIGLAAVLALMGYRRRGAAYAADVEPERGDG